MGADIVEVTFVERADCYIVSRFEAPHRTSDFLTNARPLSFLL